MSNFVANLPHLKCYVRKEYLHDLNKGHGEFVDCVIIAVKSIQGRALMFEAYLPDYGACFDKFPLSAFVWRKDIKEDEKTLPLLAYGKSKDYNEKQLQASGKNFVILRLGSVYGYSTDTTRIDIMTNLF